MESIQAIALLQGLSTLDLQDFPGLQSGGKSNISVNLHSARWYARAPHHLLPQESEGRASGVTSLCHRGAPWLALLSLPLYQKGRSLSCAAWVSWDSDIRRRPRARAELEAPPCFPAKPFGASPPSHRCFEASGSIPNPARQGFARKQRGDLSPRAGLRPASVASVSLCRNPRGSRCGVAGNGRRFSGRKQTFLQGIACSGGGLAFSS